MNKEINSNNFQTGGHHEGQENNIAQKRVDGTNNPPTYDDAQESPKTREAEQDRKERLSGNTSGK